MKISFVIRFLISLLYATLISSLNVQAQTAPMCGMPAQPCCSGSTCTPGLTCTNGMCNASTTTTTAPATMCGMLQMTCCAGGLCNNGLACQNGLCVNNPNANLSQTQCLSQYNQCIDRCLGWRGAWGANSSCFSSCDRAFPACSSSVGQAVASGFNNGFHQAVNAAVQGAGNIVVTLGTSVYTCTQYTTNLPQTLAINYMTGITPPSPNTIFYSCLTTGAAAGSIAIGVVIPPAGAALGVASLSYLSYQCIQSCTSSSNQNQCLEACGQAGGAGLVTLGSIAVTSAGQRLYAPSGAPRVTNDPVANEVLSAAQVNSLDQPIFRAQGPGYVSQNILTGSSSMPSNPNSCALVLDKYAPPTTVPLAGNVTVTRYPQANGGNGLNFTPFPRVAENYAATGPSGTQIYWTTPRQLMAAGGKPYSDTGSICYGSLFFRMPQGSSVPVSVYNPASPPVTPANPIPPSPWSLTSSLPLLTTACMPECLGCGSLDLPCCTSGSFQCNNGLTCTGGFCKAPAPPPVCGAPGTACCAGNLCNTAGHACMGGLCMPCGAPSMVCCGGTQCNAPGAVCRNGMCPAP